MTDRDRFPATVSTWITIGSSLIVALSLAVWQSLTIPLAGIGVGCVIVGLYRRSRRLLGIASGWYTLAVVVAALSDAPVEILLLTMVLVVLAWDAGQRAIALEEQLGHVATTIRLELLHTAINGLVGILAIGVVYTASAFLSVSYSIAPLLFLCSSVVLLLFALQMLSTADESV